MEARLAAKARAENAEDLESAPVIAAELNGRRDDRSICPPLQPLSSFGRVGLGWWLGATVVTLGSVAAARGSTESGFGKQKVGCAMSTSSSEPMAAMFPPTCRASLSQDSQPGAQR